MVTLNSLGLDLARSVVYGVCALLAPVGYNRCRDPDNQPFGLSLLPGYAQGRCVADTGEICLPGEGDRSLDQVDALRERYGRGRTEGKHWPLQNLLVHHIALTSCKRILPVFSLHFLIFWFVSYQNSTG